jgi:ferrochelatase
MRSSLSGPAASSAHDRGDMPGYDAILLVGFGGPEGRDDVLPFLENVTRGRDVPRARLLQVAEHYYHFDGVSPINAQVRELIAALRSELDRHRISLPIFWGNRNWHPMLEDSLCDMARRGVKKALAVVLAAYSSYSSCRQYREDIARAQAAVGPCAPAVDKVRVFYNHPEFVAANAARIREGLQQVPASLHADFRVAFTAHSIPASMARTCDYERQLRETCRLVAEGIGVAPERWMLVYQSRSGRPDDPWLAPDILDHLTTLRHQQVRAVLIHPIGFLSDHIEVLYDLDFEARLLGEKLGLQIVRARTVGTHPHFVSALRELIAERLEVRTSTDRRSVGHDGPSHDVCPEACCPAPGARRHDKPASGGPDSR